jgi:hypothetical protein
MANRTIFDQDPDPVRLFEELYEGGVRDYKGLPLGDVAGHAARRFTVCYGAMCLIRVLALLERIPPGASFLAAGAADQDKQVSGDFAAAHLIPCELRLSAPGRPVDGTLIHELLRNPFNRMWVRREIFAETDRVHRLVNVADSSCERGQDGMVRTLVSVCDKVLADARRDGMLVQAGRLAPPLTTVYQTLAAGLIPSFLAVARARLRALDAKLTDHERSELSREHPVYPDGQPFVARPADTRLTSTDREVRAAARIALRQVLSVYAEAEADRSALAAMASKIDALRINEFVRL